ncbi:carbohydrate ABC transporter permease [Glycomyces salinus]|uniref:carbohydrate ABC transporter permease n=1 Tax=Glycomyces salinus TaxID=980294 RepID=UPI0018ED87C3|nr:sugar ABC transporter permease [Glycomyces salinus]
MTSTGLAPDADVGADARASKRPRHWTYALKWKGAAFTAPFFLGFVLLFIIPLGYAVWQSLYRERAAGSLGLSGTVTEFVGFENFADVFEDPKFWTAMIRVLVFAFILVPVMLSISLAMALLLDMARRTAVRFYRLGFLVPYMVPGIVAALMWIYIYSPRSGPITPVFDGLGIGVNFFASEMLWISIGNLIVWNTIGFNMLIIYAGLLSVPRELFEAARLDGAGEWRIAWSIKIPHVRGPLALTGMLAIINLVQIFNEPVLFRQVSPETVTKDFTPILFIYNQAFNANDYNYAAALSVVLALVVGAVSFVYYKLANRPAS